LLNSTPEKNFPFRQARLAAKQARLAAKQVFKEGRSWAKNCLYFIILHSFAMVFDKKKLLK